MGKIEPTEEYKKGLDLTLEEKEKVLWDLLIKYHIDKNTGIVNSRTDPNKYTWWLCSDGLYIQGLTLASACYKYVKLPEGKQRDKVLATIALLLKGLTYYEREGRWVRSVAPSKEVNATAEYQYTIGDWSYYGDNSRDQMCGLLMGLDAVIKHVPSFKQQAKELAISTHHALCKDGCLSDHFGERTRHGGLEWWNVEGLLIRLGFAKLAGADYTPDFKERLILHFNICDFTWFNRINFNNQNMNAIGHFIINNTGGLLNHKRRNGRYLNVFWHKLYGNTDETLLEYLNTYSTERRIFNVDNRDVNRAPLFFKNRFKEKTSEQYLPLHRYLSFFCWTDDMRELSNTFPGMAGQQRYIPTDFLLAYWM